MAELHTLANARKEAATKSIDVFPVITDVKSALIPKHLVILLPARGPAKPKAVKAAKAPLVNVVSSFGASSSPLTTLYNMIILVLYFFNV